MGGRMFDPRMARFLERDPVVVNPALDIDYNRYQYPRGNPLRC